MKCRFCNSEEDLKWNEPYKKGDRPVRSLDGKPHICKSNKPQEITADVQRIPEDEKLLRRKAGLYCLEHPFERIRKPNNACPRCECSPGCLEYFCPRLYK